MLRTARDLETSWDYFATAVMLDTLTEVFVLAPSHVVSRARMLVAGGMYGDGERSPVVSGDDGRSQISSVVLNGLGWSPDGIGWSPDGFRWYSIIIRVHQGQRI